MNIKQKHTKTISYNRYFRFRQIFQKFLVFCCQKCNISWEISFIDRNIFGKKSSNCQFKCILVAYCQNKSEVQCIFYVICALSGQNMRNFWNIRRNLKYLLYVHYMVRNYFYVFLVHVIDEKNFFWMQYCPYFSE